MDFKLDFHSCSADIILHHCINLPGQDQKMYFSALRVFDVWWAFSVIKLFHALHIMPCPCFASVWPLVRCFIFLLFTKRGKKVFSFLIFFLLPWAAWWFVLYAIIPSPEECGVFIYTAACISCSRGFWTGHEPRALPSFGHCALHDSRTFMDVKILNMS